MSNHNDKNRLNSGDTLTAKVEGNPEPSDVIYLMRNKSKSEQTADPSKYPQGYFKDKPCKKCRAVFTPKSPAEHYCSDPCKDIATGDAYLLRTYGIDTDEYNRMLKQQGSLCALCHTEGWTMAKHHKLKLVVDHCHTTGKVRGLLCHNCNRALGLLQDNPSVMRRCADYIEGATTIP
jgi:hypothetical protein